MSIANSAKKVVQEAAQTVIKKAVELAPDRMMPGGKPDPLIDRPRRHVGKPLSRIDGALKVRGKATFAAEFHPSGMVYASVAFSTIAKGKIAMLDTTEAEAAPGVVAVMTHRNAPRMKPMPLFMTEAKAAGGDDLAVMQDDLIYWNGQPIAVVLAETQEQADEARSLIRATYEEQSATISFEHAIANGTEPGVFQGQPLKQEVGDAEAALAAAEVKVDAVYHTPRNSHNAIELHAVTVEWENGELKVHDASQLVAHTAWSLAQVFGLKEKQVHVTSPFVGGGFGGKTLWQHQVLAAAASKLVNRPVRLALSREGVYRVVGGRTLTEQRVAIGAKGDGKFDAIIHTGAVAMSRHNALPEPFIFPTRGAYASSNLKFDVEVAYVDFLANTFMRAPGEAVGTFALECAVDELATKLGMDPIELRIINEPEKNPTEGTPFSSRHIVEAYRAGAARFGWEKRQSAAGSVRDGEWLVGMGCATATYPYYRMPGGAARITLTRDGRAKVEAAAHEMGMGTATAQTQVAAERLGLEMGEVTFGYGDSAMPGVILAGGSQQSASVGASLAAAQHELFAELLKLAGKASPLAGLKADEVVGVDGGLAKIDDASRRESYGEILGRAGRDQITVEASAPPPLELEHWSMHSYGAMFCEVRVSAVTGEIRVSRFLGSFDCGRILNPKTASSQFRGGIIMGLGLALMEETKLDDRKGRIMNRSLSEYHVPSHMDVPEIEVMWLDIPDPHTPMGARGIGEIGITGTSAAVANAVFNATGKRVRDLPITLDKVVG